MEFVLNSRAIVQVIWCVVIKQISHWCKRAFSVMLYTLTYISQTSVANICQTKAVSHVNSDLAETIEGVNMTFPPVPKQRLPSVELQAFLPPAPFSAALHACFTCTAPLCWHHNAWAASDPGMPRLLLLLFEEQLHRPSRDYVRCESDGKKKKLGTVCPVKNWMPYINW